MIIKIIPEEGDVGVTEVEHTNVKEFFMFGTKKKENGDFIDFHDWRGGYGTLIPRLAYFEEVIKDERVQSRNNNLQQNSIVKEIKLTPPTEDIEVENEIDNVINLKAHLNTEADKTDKADKANKAKVSPSEAKKIANEMLEIEKDKDASEATLEDE